MPVILGILGCMVLAALGPLPEVPKAFSAITALLMKNSAKNLTIFLGVVALMLPLILGPRRFRTAMFFAHILALPLVLPTLKELKDIFSEGGKLLTVYSTEQIEVAKKLRDYLPPQVIVQAAPDHNSVITLTGHTLFYGYEGTLSSHGLVYQERRRFASSLSELPKCAKELATPEVCPQFLYYEPWNTFWRGQTLSPLHYKAVPEIPNLYKIVL